MTPAAENRVKSRLLIFRPSRASLATGSGEWYDLYLQVMPAIQSTEPIKVLQHVLTIDFTRRLRSHVSLEDLLSEDSSKRSRAPCEPELTGHSGSEIRFHRRRHGLRTGTLHDINRGDYHVVFRSQTSSSSARRIPLSVRVASAAGV